MALTKFTGAINTIQSLPDKPNQDGGLTAAQVKLKFDQHAIDNEEYINNTLTEELDALDAANVKKTGEQTIQGIKTFESSPIVPTPTTDMQASTKKYVDDKDIARKAYVDDNFTTKIEMSTNRKLSATGDFTGTINGLQPIQVDPYISAVVEEHTTQLADIVLFPEMFYEEDDIDDTSSIQKALDKAYEINGIVELRLKRYVISSPLKLYRNTHLRGRTNTYGTGQYKFENDFEKENPSFLGFETIIQYPVGSHGAIFDTSENYRLFKIENITFRVGQTRTSEDVVFNNRFSASRLYSCKFENFNSIYFDAIGDKQCQDNNIIGNIVISGNLSFRAVLVDNFFQDNRFVNVSTAIYLNSGSNANKFSGNRFEWGGKGIEIYGASRLNIISECLFDALSAYGVGLKDGASDNVVINNIFNRCGRNNTSHESCFVYIKQDSSKNKINNNKFRYGAGDSDSTILGPCYVISLENVGNAYNEFLDNSTFDGYTTRLVYDRYNNSTNALIINYVDISNGTMNFNGILEIINRVVCGDCVAKIYESKTITDYKNHANIIIEGTGTDVVLSGTGSIQAKLYKNLTYYSENIDKNGRVNRTPQSGKWDTGFRLEFSSPVNNIGCVCITGGTPGTWKNYGAII